MIHSVVVCFREITLACFELLGTFSSVLLTCCIEFLRATETHIIRDNPYTGRKLGTMERNAHEEIITGTELATVPIPVGNSVVLPEGGSHLHHADDRDSNRRYRPSA